MQTVDPHPPWIPDIFQFWYTTTLFRPEKGHQKVRKLAQTGEKQICENFAVSMQKKVHRLEKSTRSPDVAVVTNISYAPL